MMNKPPRHDLPKACKECGHVQGELENYHNELERLVEERTTALRKTMDDLEAANKAKSIFLSNMSHELRTPLNAILGFSRQMQREPEMSSEHQKKLGAIHSAGEHLLALINDVLELTRSDENSALQRNVPFVLPDFLNEIDDAVRHRAHAKKLAFRIALSPELPAMVQGQPERLRKVLTALLGNAVKYTMQGEISLQVTAQGKHVRFEVADTGSGISPEEQEHIFQPFYQTATGIAQGEGTGLGLYLSREYARLMGGSLNLRHDPDWSCVFVLDIPLPMAIASAMGTVIGLAPDTPPIRLLIVDDQEDNRWLATALLHPVGFSVETAENGQQAIAAFLTSPPDLICMDMRMPVLDGYEATRRIRDLPGGTSIKIVAMTASILDTEKKEILAAGCDAIISKPLDDNEIFATLAALLHLNYRYADGEINARPAANVGPQAPCPALPSEYRNALTQAAERLELEECREIESRIKAENPAAAEYLKILLDQFRFDEVLQWCTQT